MISYDMRFLLCIFTFLLASLPHLEAAPGNKCPPREHWVSPHHRRAYTRADGTSVKASDVEGHCQKNPGDFHVWNLKLKNGRPPSWRTSAEKSTEWTVEERERVSEALEETPAFLKNQDIDGIYRMKESQTPGNPGARHGADIVLYDKAFDSSEILTHVLNHEMAHISLEALSPDELASFLAAAKWEEKRRGTSRTHSVSRPASQFIRPNGMLSYQEDFADDVAVYVHQPDRFKKLSPEIFDWMEKHLKPRLSRGSHK